MKGKANAQVVIEASHVLKTSLSLCVSVLIEAAQFPALPLSLCRTDIETEGANTNRPTTCPRTAALAPRSLPLLRVARIGHEARELHNVSRHHLSRKHCFILIRLCFLLIRLRPAIRLCPATSPAPSRHGFSRALG